MMMRRVLVLALLALPQSIHAQKVLAPAGEARRAESRVRHWYVSVGGFATSMRNPFLREPGTQDGGGTELQTRQIVNVGGGRAGFGYRGGRLGGEIAFSYWQPARLADFVYFNPNSPDSTRYTDVTVGLWQVDLVVLAAPLGGVPIWAYGVLGMGQQRKHYTLSDNGASFFNGRRELNEMNYTPGLGLRFVPLRQVALFAEARWLPGDATTSVPDEGCYIYVRRAAPLQASVSGSRGSQAEACKTNTNFGHLLSAGVSISLP